MQLKALAKPKILVPLVLLLWLAVAIPLSIVSYAAEVTDSACGDTTSTSPNYWARGVWGMPEIDPYFDNKGDDNKNHLALVDPNNACYQINSDLKSGYLVYGEWWKDYNKDRYGCITTDKDTAYRTCSDEDMNWYLKLSPSELDAAKVSDGEVKNLQRWSQCKGGQKDPSKWCNFLVETIPQGGNYGFWDPTGI